MESEHEPDIGGGAGRIAERQRLDSSSLAVRPAGGASDTGGDNPVGGNLARPRAIHWSIDGRAWHRVARPADLSGAIDYLISVGAMVRL